MKPHVGSEVIEQGDTHITNYSMAQWHVYPLDTTVRLAIYLIETSIETSLPTCGFIAQLVEHRTGIAEVTGSNPVEALIFSGFFFPVA